jgi:hypothetical protein
MKVRDACSSAPISIRNLSEPINITLVMPSTTSVTYTAASTRRIKCRRRERRDVNITCRAEGLAVTPVTVTGECDGTKDEELELRCPVMAACVWWDEKKKAWSGEGCKTIGSGPQGVQCQCDHLTDFSGIRHVDTKALVHC